MPAPRCSVSTGTSSTSSGCSCSRPSSFRPTSDERAEGGAGPCGPGPQAPGAGPMSDASLARESHSIGSAIGEAILRWYALLGGIGAWAIHLLVLASVV